MKQFTLATALIILITCLWYFIFLSPLYRMEYVADTLDNEVLPLVEEEKFDKALKELNNASKDIYPTLDTAAYFTESEIILEISQTLKRSEEFLKAEDVSNGSGEITSLSKSLRFILNSQRPTISNIL